MLGRVKGEALPKGRKEYKVEGVVMKEDYSLPYNSAEVEMKAKKALHQNVKDHKMKY